MGREGDHKGPIGLGAEGQTKPAATAAALNPEAGTGAAGRTSDKAHALVVEHRWCIGRHHTDRRDALAHQGRCRTAGFGGGVDHQPFGRCLLQCGLILGAHRVVGERPGCPQMTAGPRQLKQQGLIDAQRIGWIRPLITGDAMAKQNPGRQRQHLLDQGSSTDSSGTGTEPIPVQPGVKARLGIATLITGQRAAGGAGAAAGAGDRNRPGFGIA